MVENKNKRAKAGRRRREVGEGKRRQGKRGWRQ